MLCVWSYVVTRKVGFLKVVGLPAAKKGPASLQALVCKFGTRGPESNRHGIATVRYRVVDY